MSGTRTGLTAPKGDGVDARVGRELGRDWGWILARTKRVERLLAQPEIMELADRVAEHIDRFCEIRELDPRDLEPDLAPTPTKEYMTLRLNGIPCAACGGKGMLRTYQLCPRCGGSGFQSH